MDNLGDILRKLREAKEFSTHTVAEYLNIGQAILHEIECGQCVPSRELVVKLAAYYSAKEDELLVSWLSDKLVYDIRDEDQALKALQVAEEKIAYNTYRKTDKKAIVNTIKTYLENDNYVNKVWLFGSFARGEDDYKSDIDVMIEVPDDSNFSLFDLAEIQYQLEKLLQKKVDVVMKDGVKPAVMERILPDLKLIYERQYNHRERKA